MQILSKRDFLKRYESVGLALADLTSPQQMLVYPTSPDLRWSWDIPTSPKDLPRFVTSLFEATEETQGFYLYPRMGTWGCGDTLKMFQMSAVFAYFGCSPQPNAVIYLSIDEVDAAETLFSISLIFGGTVSDDLFVIPSHGKLMLYADHHEAVHATFSDNEFMKRYLSNVPEEWTS